MTIGQHILITGSNGFVGRHLSATLIARGARVSKIVRPGKLLEQTAGGQYAIDLVDRDSVLRVFDLLQPTYVVHLASSKYRGDDSVQRRDAYIENLSTSLNLIDACRAVTNFQRMIFLGTCDEYGSVDPPYNEKQSPMPTNGYGVSKLAVTKILLELCERHQFPSVVLRPTVIYGPGQSDDMFVSTLIRSLLAGSHFETTLGGQTRDFVYVDDVVEAVIKALLVGDRSNGMIVNIGSGQSITIREVATMVADMIGPRAIDLLRFGSIPYRLNEVMNYSASIVRARERLGWVPQTSLRDGLLRTVQSFRNFADEVLSGNHA